MFYDGSVTSWADWQIENKRRKRIGPMTAGIWGVGQERSLGRFSLCGNEFFEIADVTRACLCGALLFLLNI